jgi:hypothetical protein
MSTCANNSFWRFELQSALFALNYGQQEPLVRPEPTRRQGNPVQLLLLKLRALQHVNFHMGKGLKKYRAQQLVAGELGQSVETLRSWEKLLLADDDLAMDLRAAQLAGEIEKDLANDSISELIKEHALQVHRNKTDVYWAKHALRDLRATPLDKIRDGLRAGRLGKKAGI